LTIILNIETATKNCSVSLAMDGELLALVELNEDNFSHAEKLHTFILEVLKKANKEMKDIDAVAISSGPGSYTGLRIGVSAAKGLCFSLDKPLISIPTLTSLANAITVEKGDMIISVLDARRMEVYSAVFDFEQKQKREIRAQIINENSFSEYLEKGKVYLLGDGAFKCKETIHHDNAVFLEGYFPSAKEMADLSYKKYIKNNFEDVAYFEPFYLKDFVAIKPKKLL
jgi:tRNA threonylcarbamoyladenosine biosynthesis protein TsaB